MTLDPLSAIILLTSIYCAGTYGGAITAVLINTPGTPAAAATCLDGYPLAQKGEAGRALGMATVSSTVGGIFSVIILVFFAPLLAKLAYEFGQPEYFALAIFGLTMLASIGDGSPIKNLIAGAFGILISTIGKDFMTSIDRFTYGINELSEGIGFIPVVVGLFAISEMLTQSTLLDQVFKRVALKAVKLPSLNDYKQTWKTILRSSGIGSFIGVLPAEGGTVASLIGYSEAKRFSKNHEATRLAGPRKRPPARTFRRTRLRLSRSLASSIRLSKHHPLSPQSSIQRRRSRTRRRERQARQELRNHALQRSR